MVLFENTNSTEDIDPLLIESTTSVVVAAFTHLRKFLPFIVFYVKHLSTMSRFVLVFTGSCNNHKGIRESANCVSMSRV